MMLDMQLASTSTQRTYRYIRLSIVGAVLAIFVSLIAFATQYGWPTSISALYYTPGATVFVGALFAVALGLLAMSGHSVEQALLDLAAVVAPLIAIVPTVVGAGDVPGLSPDCGDAAACVPDQYLPDIANGMVTFAVVGGVGVVTALVLAVAQRTLSRGVLVAIAVATAIVAGMTIWWAVDPDSFVPSAHLVATIAFLGLMALVSLMAAAGAAGTSYRTVYGVTSALFVLSLIFLLVVSLAQFNGSALVGAPLILIGECVALALFALFWLAQTAQKWDEVDPSLI
jgi:hypothetical protein